MRWGAPAALGAAALALWALAPTYPNYDSYYHLVWGRELLDAVKPTFEVYAAPTQHPLWVLAGAVLWAPLGEDADRALVLLCLASHVALILGAYRLGEAVFGRWPGVLAAVFVAGSASFFLYAIRGYVDTPFLALVVWAAALEAQGRGPRAPMGMLVVAGLLRPEAWVLAGLYALWLRRPRAFMAAGAAPVLWVLSDLAVTGDALHSLRATSELAEDLNRPRGLDEVPGSFVSYLAATVRPPVAALALAGVALAWRLRGVVAIRVPLALLAAGAATFVGSGVVGLSILPRYLTVPAVALCVFAGYALAGFTTVAGRLAEMWRAAAVGAGVLGVVALAFFAPSLDNVRDEFRLIRDYHDDLVRLLDEPRLRAGLACGPLSFPNYRLVPDARWHLDARAGRVVARSERRPRHGVAVFVRGGRGLRRFGYAEGVSRTTNRPDPGYRRLVANARFVAYLSCP